jgi:uncharacterized membrane protein YeaQ/YmgE (transglycosylase-associated protein family)
VWWLALNRAAASGQADSSLP